MRPVHLHDRVSLTHHITSLCCLFLLPSLGIADTKPKPSPGTQPSLNAKPSPSTKPRPTSQAQDAGAQLRQRVVPFRLSNGMLFLLVRRPGAPTFSGYIRVKVGGVDENTGDTGLAHFLEHMAFKGTSVVGTRDWAKEQKVLGQLFQTGDALSLAKRRNGGRSTALTRWLQRRFRKLRKRHQRLLRKDEFTRLYQANGGTGINASTGKDLTTYHLSLPSNRLALWAHQEASRLAAPVFREFYRERKVVIEERRSAMSKGGSRLYEQFIATAFTAHPYRFPTVGWLSDLSTMSYHKLRRFFHKYYVPNNMVGAIVGDIDIEKTKTLLKQSFGKLKAGPTPPVVNTIEPKQQGERRVNVRFHTRPQLMIGFHKPTAPHADDTVFDVIESLLTSGRDSRLYRALEKKQIAKSVWASSFPGARYANLFTIAAQPVSPHRTADVEKVIYQELKRLRTEKVSKRELQKVLNKVRINFLRGLRSNNGLANQLSYYHAIVGDWRYATTHSERMGKVTPEAIMRVAKQYLVKRNRTVATLVQNKPKTEAPGDELKALKLNTPRTKPHPRAVRAPKAPTSLPTKLRQHAQRLLAQSTVAPTIGTLPKGLQHHPRTLTYPPLRFKAPIPTSYKLPNGLRLYLLEDHELPLVNVYSITKTGRLYDPPSKIGLGQLMGKAMRSGGFGKWKSDDIDQALAFRGAQLAYEVDNEMGFGRLSVHQRDLRWGLTQLLALLRSPHFDKAEIKRQKISMMESYLRRNDRPFRLAINSFRKRVYGANSRWAMYPVPATIKAITRQDLVDLHRKHYRPNNTRFAIVGDFHTPTLLAMLRKMTKSWKAGKTNYPTLKALPTKTKPGVFVIKRPLPQSLIFVGHLGPRRQHPQLIAGEVMNHILGGGGFSSRLMTEIRTNRGLAYFAGSQLYADRDRGLFVAYTGTQPKKTSVALKTMLNVLQHMHKKSQISPAELELTRKTLLNQFIFKFNSRAQIVYRKAYYDFLGYPPNYLEQYRKKLHSLTAKDVQQAARTFLKPDQFVIQVIGWPAAFDKPLDQFGKIQVIRE